MLRAILAGVLIGVGDIAIMTIDNPYISALVFAVALLSIIQLKLPLYTGRIGKVFKNKNLLGCIVLLIFNSIGVVLTFMLFFCMGKHNHAIAVEIADAKFTHTILALFTAGILCNILIHIAVTAKREIITVLCVMAFILCGFEHSVADVGYAVMSFNVKYIGMWFVVVLGNAVGGIMTEMLLFDRKEIKQL